MTAGTKLCKALIGSYDQWILRKSDTGASADKLHVVTALKCLLAVSQSAKAAALECKYLQFCHYKKEHAHSSFFSLITENFPLIFSYFSLKNRLWVLN